MDVDGYLCRGEGVGLTHTKNLMTKKLKSTRETGQLETEGENAKKKPPFGHFFESYFDLPNHYSNNVVIMDSDFMLTERRCAIAIIAYVSFKIAKRPTLRESRRISSFYGNRVLVWKG